MSSRDDMVFIPDLSGMTAPTDAVDRMREERKMAAAGKRGGWANRLRRLKQARRARKVHRRRTTKGVAQRGMARRAGGLAARGAGVAARRAAGTPIGLMVAAVVTAAIVRTRIMTGTPLEGLGQQLNDAFLGQYDDEARAATRTRARFQTDPALSFIAGKEGVTKQQVRLFEDLKMMAQREEVGASALRNAFPQNSTYDILVVKMAKLFGEESKNSLRSVLLKAFRRFVHVLNNPTSGRKRKSR